MTSVIRQMAYLSLSHAKEGWGHNPADADLMDGSWIFLVNHET